MDLSAMRHVSVSPALSGVVGVLLLGAAVAYKLLGSTYAHDVVTLCNAEAASHLTVSSDTARLTIWIQEHLATPEGGRLFASLRDRPLPERGLLLQRESQVVGLETCPLVHAYDDLSRRWDGRREMQDLCSNTTFPELAMLDESSRLQALEEWIDAQGSTPVSLALAAKLREATTAVDGATRLRDAAADVGVLTCDVAKTLLVPVTLSCGR
jgi:hypothetical protein